MKRKAILLGSTSTGLASSTAKDIDNIYDHLTGVNGGAWEQQEIDILLNKSSDEIIAYMNILKRTLPDLYFLYWTGHGAHNVALGNLLLEVGPSDEMSASHLNIGAQRQLMFFDTCRVLDYSRSTTACFKASFESFGESNELLRQTSRRAYEESFSMVTAATYTYYSSQMGKPSFTSPDGTSSVFTDALMQVAATMKHSSPPSYQSGQYILSPKTHAIGDVVNSTIPICQNATKDKNEGPQTPTYSGPNILSRLTPPFVVSL